MKTDDNTNSSENRKANNGSGENKNNNRSKRSNASGGDKGKANNGNRSFSAKGDSTTGPSAPNKNPGSGNRNNPASGNRNKRYNHQHTGRNGQQKGNNANRNSSSLALNNHQDSGFFETFATWVSKAAGSTYAFMGAILLVLGWAVAGPFFNFSETWQLVINTGTTIITFLMVFLIQKAQNKDSLAIQLKLNELVASHEYSSNRLVDIENMTEDEMKIVQKYYRSLSELSKKEEKLQTSHSIEEAEDQHESKSRRRSRRYRDDRQ